MHHARVLRDHRVRVVLWVVRLRVDRGDAIAQSERPEPISRNLHDLCESFRQIRTQLLEVRDVIVVFEERDDRVLYAPEYAHPPVVKIGGKTVSAFALLEFSDVKVGGDDG